MDKDSKITILGILGVAVILTAGTLIVIRFTRKQHFSLKRIAKIISNPEKLSSPDQKDSWKKIDPDLLLVLEKLSKKFGKKLTINSGYRSLAHNRSVGGATRSAHMTGEAVDIKTPSYSEAIKIGRKAKQFGIKRMGVAKTFIHIDVSKTLPQTRWAYSGTGISKSKINRDLGFS